MKLLGLIGFIVALFVLGSICLFWPRAVQEYAARNVGASVAPLRPGLHRFIQSSSYLVSVRFVGVVAYLMLSLLLLVLYREHT